MAVQRVQVIQKNVDRLIQKITDNQLQLAADRVKQELQDILNNETEGTGDLADSVQVHRGTQRGKPILRILTARHGIFLFRGTQAPYANFPPDAESEERFNFWALRHGFKPKRLAFIIAKGHSRGKVYQDRSDMLIKALRNGLKF